MGFWSNLFALSDFEAKSSNINYTEYKLPNHSAASVEAALWNEQDGDRHFAASAVYACARVIAEGLALPPCYVHKASGSGKALATTHALFPLLNASPNERQTSYEFREQLGYHLSLNSNAFVFVTRSVSGDVLELLPLDPGSVTVWCDPALRGAPVNYLLWGQPVPLAAAGKSGIWHLKGPSWLSYEGMATVREARKAINLAQATEKFGANLFTNGARPGGILSPSAKGTAFTPDQANEIKQMWAAQASGVNNAHKTILLTAPVDYSPMASTANEAQWTEARRYQLEEICRFFRVSPTKVFSQVGSQSYASVEQAHIAHDQDTDAHWHERFVQSANKALLTDAERRRGFTVGIDNRSALRGTAGERMAYYTAGLQSGLFTVNECRQMEGFDRSGDPAADKLTPAANLFGDPKTPDAPTVDEEPKNNG